MLTEFSLCKSGSFAQYTSWDLVFLLEFYIITYEVDGAADINYTGKPTTAKGRATSTGVPSQNGQNGTHIISFCPTVRPSIHELDPKTFMLALCGFGIANGHCHHCDDNVHDQRLNVFYAHTNGGHEFSLSMVMPYEGLGPQSPGQCVQWRLRISQGFVARRAGLGTIFFTAVDLARYRCEVEMIQSRAPGDPSHPNVVLTSQRHRLSRFKLTELARRGPIEVCSHISGHD
ncbi:hypothetical protein EVAR_64457_1 [Eumeta japonica]|uniref:Uncharacterized protein n=1 Tax=Eumeta variegata TaxID=151549 RepID=A0A4C1ZI03_EUMVA|nr:hypothetical protein EVAR_64457_1 [Eumeta japonica]